MILPVMHSEPIFSDRAPYRSLGQNLVSVPIPNQFFPVDLEPIPVRSRSQTSRDQTRLYRSIRAQPAPFMLLLHAYFLFKHKSLLKSGEMVLQLLYLKNVSFEDVTVVSTVLVALKKGT